jgi:transposase InsO family protein
VPWIEALIIAAKKKRPTWGSKKLENSLDRRHPGIQFPSRCTIDVILNRNGLVAPRRRRRLIPSYPEHLVESHASNDVWCTDFKGQFRLGNGKLCYPLTITDHLSRYIISCTALEGPTTEAAFAGFEEVFKRCGLPLRQALHLTAATPSSRGPWGNKVWLADRSTVTKAPECQPLDIVECHPMSLIVRIDPSLMVYLRSE